MKNPNMNHGGRNLLGGALVAGALAVGAGVVAHEGGAPVASAEAQAPVTYTEIGRASGHQDFSTGVQPWADVQGKEVIGFDVEMIPGADAYSMIASCPVTNGESDASKYPGLNKFNLSAGSFGSNGVAGYDEVAYNESTIKLETGKVPASQLAHELAQGYVHIKGDVTIPKDSMSSFDAACDATVIAWKAEAPVESTTTAPDTTYTTVPEQSTTSYELPDPTTTTLYEGTTSTEPTRTTEEEPKVAK